jgi:hypothetical protein
MLKQNKDGTWQIQTGDDLEAAVAAVEERQEAIHDLEQEMEEQYDYLTMKREVEDLTEAIRLFMVENDHKHVFRDTYKLTLIQRANTRWDESKLRKLLPKSLWLKVTKQVVDRDKIDDLVREGKIDEKTIAPALVSTPVKPHIQRYDYKKGQDRDAAIAEEERLRQQLQGEATAKAEKPKKRKKATAK